MSKKCLGCGSLLQYNDENMEGFVLKEDALLCQRCFRIKYYGDYTHVNKEHKFYDNIFNSIKSKDNLVLFLCDILSLDETLNYINGFKNVILVMTKSDLLPKSVKKEKLKSYILKNYKLNILDIIFVSSVKNYNIDSLMNLIKKYNKKKEVYLVGNTNAGKSSLINTIIKCYLNKESMITTSLIPATTLDTINVKIDDNLTFIDTPGIIDNSNYLTGEKPKIVKLLTPKKEIKPRTYQMKPNQSIIIGDYARIDYKTNDKNSFTLYLSNDIKVKRINLNTNNYLRNLKKHSFDLEKDKDIVISGLCFCKIVGNADIDIYVKDNVKVFERDNLI